MRNPFCQIKPIEPIWQDNVELRKNSNILSQWDIIDIVIPYFV